MSVLSTSECHKVKQSRELSLKTKPVNYKDASSASTVVRHLSRWVWSSDHGFIFCFSSFSILSQNYWRLFLFSRNQSCPIWVLQIYHPTCFPDLSAVISADSPDPGVSTFWLTEHTWSRSGRGVDLEDLGWAAMAFTILASMLEQTSGVPSLRFSIRTARTSSYAFPFPS